MKYLVTVLVFSLLMVHSAYADTPTPPADTPTPTGTEMATEQATPTNTPDTTLYVPLPSGKSGAVTYLISAGDLGQFGFWTVIVMLIGFDAYIRLRTTKTAQ